MKLSMNLSFLAVLAASTLFAQVPDRDWYLMHNMGTDVESVYKTLPAGEKGREVVVAIIDSGVDFEHEDLADNIWVNEDEVPGNNIDDDNNGYIDDIHGWNFIGGPNGENVNSETLEVTRLYRKYRDYFANKDIDNLKKKDKQLYAVYLDLRNQVEGERQALKESLDNVQMNERMVMDVLNAFDLRYPDQPLTDSFIESFDPGDDPEMQAAKSIFEQSLSFNIELETVAQLKDDIATGFEPSYEDIGDRLNYWYNPDFNSREIIQDDYANSYERYYGNNDVKGPRNFHGTHVSGIIGATRGNDVGIDGIADNVKLMIIRTVPDGDEHDKDVANAILYAVENGASIVNMSFGKGYSWDKEAVDKAVKKARKEDVLLVHAAGNEGADNDVVAHYPTRDYEKRALFSKKSADNWIEVGAISWESDENAIASFSNYGSKSVDIFAPGAQIYSTAPDNDYQFASGTSMAAPVVAGVAALLRSRYPALTATQVKDIIMKSSTRLTTEVRQPGTHEMVKMHQLCRSGGIVNVPKAFELAATTKGKKKVQDKSAKQTKVKQAKA